MEQCCEKEPMKAASGGQTGSYTVIAGKLNGNGGQTGS